MKKLFIIGLLLLSFMLISAKAEDLSKFGYEVSTNYRVIEKGKTVTQNGHGTAIGVDLSKYSINDVNLTGKFYLTTAAHVIFEKDAIGPVEILVKIPNVGIMNGEIIAIDIPLDIAIIKTKVELPFITQIDMSPINIGLDIVNVGCPERSLPTATNGKIVDTYKESFEVNAKGFYHGSSGGGMFRISNEKLIGISTNGIADKSDPLGMKRGVGIFIPIKFLRMILDFK